jgi:outer membrane immunogenic protein
MKTKTLSIAALAVSTFALISAPVSAADLAAKAPPPQPAPAPVYSWTGCYGGGGFGYGLWRQDVTEFDPSGVQFGINNTNGGSGWLGFVQGGCDYQFPLYGQSVVIGAFADYDWTDINGDAVISPEGAGTFGDSRAFAKQSSAWAAGGRIGWVALPQLLVFGSGGWTQARFDQLNLVEGLSGASNFGISIAAHTYSGWFLGTGYEYAFSFVPGLYWRTEYRWSDFGSAQLPDLFASGVPTGFTHTFRVREQAVLSSLIWRFNWGGH